MVAVQKTYDQQNEILKLKADIALLKAALESNPALIATSSTVEPDSTIIFSPKTTRTIDPDATVVFSSTSGQTRGLGREDAIIVIDNE